MANYKYRKYGTRVNKNYRENNGEKASKKLDMRLKCTVCKKSITPPTQRAKKFEIVEA